MSLTDKLKTIVEKRPRADDDGDEDLPSSKKQEFEIPRPETSFFRAFLEQGSVGESSSSPKGGTTVTRSDSKADLADGLAVDAPLAPVQTTRTLDDVPRSNEKHVLVVDDSLTTRRFVQRIFESHGYKVDVCHNGWQAFAQMQSRLYDFVFLDIEMPVMNGFRCAQAIRKWEDQVGRKERQVICALTSHAEDHERELGRDIGMNFFEAKPANSKRLLEMVDDAVKMADGHGPTAAALAAIATAHSCGKLKDLDQDRGAGNSEGDLPAVAAAAAADKKDKDDRPGLVVVGGKDSQPTKEDNKIDAGDTKDKKQLDDDDRHHQQKDLPPPPPPHAKDDVKGDDDQDDDDDEPPEF